MDLKLKKTSKALHTVSYFTILCKIFHRAKRFDVYQTQKFKLINCSHGTTCSHLTSTLKHHLTTDLESDIFLSVSTTDLKFQKYAPFMSPHILPSSSFYYHPIFS